MIRHTLVRHPPQTVNNKFHSIKCTGLLSKSLASLPFHSIIKYFLSFYYELIILSIIRSFHHGSISFSIYNFYVKSICYMYVFNKISIKHKSLDENKLLSSSGFTETALWISLGISMWISLIIWESL